MAVWAVLCQTYWSVVCRLQRVIVVCLCDEYTLLLTSFKLITTIYYHIYFITHKCSTDSKTQA